MGVLAKEHVQERSNHREGKKREYHRTDIEENIEGNISFIVPDVAEKSEEVSHVANINEKGCRLFARK
jgi:hypothetical protein